MTSKRSPLKGDQLTLFAVDFPAKTSAQQEDRQASKKAQDLGFSMNSCESFAWFDQTTSCWKTFQQSLLTGSTLFSGKLPRQGLMLNGQLYQHAIWEHVINVPVGGSLPTPTLSDYLDRSYHYPACTGVTRGEKLAWAIGKHLGHNHGLNGTPGTNRSILTGEPMYLNPCFLEEMMGFPIGWTESKH